MKKTYKLLFVLAFASAFQLRVSAQCGTTYSLSSAFNSFGMISNQNNPVAVDKNLNTVVFLHRHNSNTYGGNSGNLRYDISTNGGTSWTSDLGVLNPISSTFARYPNAVIYNPVSNTNTNNAYIGYLCPTTNGSTWGNIVSGIRQLSGSGNTENYNQAGVQAYFLPRSMVKGAPGVFWAVDFAGNGTNATGNLLIYKGVWNSNSNDIIWSVNANLNPPLNTSAYGEWPVIGFDPTGQLGWVAFVHDNGSVGYYSFTFYSTTNGGLSWTGPQQVNLNQFTCLVSSIGGGGNQVTAHTRYDMSVDVNGNPHVLCMAGKNVSYAIDATAWHHMLDLTRSNNAWVIKDLGSILSDVYYFTGSVTGANAALQFSSPQCARSFDGTKIFFSWTDNVNSSQGTPLSNPNLYSKAYNVSTNMWTPMKDFSSCNANTAGKIFFPHLAEEVLEPSNGNFKIAPVYAEFSSPANDVDITTSFRFLDNCLFSASEFSLSSPLSANISPGPNVLLCQGQGISLQLNGIYNSVLWSNNGTSNSIFVNSPGNYSVTVNSGCNTATAGVTVSQMTLSVNASSPSICSGKTVALIANGNAQSYTWNPGNITGTNMIFASPNVTSSYTLSASGTSCTTNAVVTVTVNQSPNVTIISNTAIICAGNTVVLQATGASAYSWDNGAIGPTVVVTPTTNTTYSCIAVSSAGCVGTFTFIQNVNPSPVGGIISNKPICCVGDQVALLATGAFSYLWSSGGSGATVNVVPLTQTNYSVVATGTNGCATTYTFTQYVDPCTNIRSILGNSQEKLSVFPNPGKGLFTIKSEIIDSDYRIFNSNGDLVSEGKLKPGDNKVELNLPLGVYLIVAGNYSARLKIVIE